MISLGISSSMIIDLKSIFNLKYDFQRNLFIIYLSTYVFKNCQKCIFTTTSNNITEFTVAVFNITNLMKLTCLK